MNEQELITLLRRGDESAFRWLVENYRNRIYNTVLNILQDEAEAEDIVQETFVQVFESIETFKEASQLSTWVYRIAVRKAIDKMRRKETRQKLQAILPWWMPHDQKTADRQFMHPGILVENKEKAAVLFKAIKGLPAKQQLAFTLIRVQGMGYGEVSGIMELSIKAIESLVSRAKENLQKNLEHFYKQ